MKKIILGNKEIEIRSINSKDLKSVNLFLSYINSLVEEGAKISINKKKTNKEEFNFLENLINLIKKNKKICLIATHNKKIVAMTDIDILEEVKNHIGDFSIGIIEGYRGVGLGKYLINDIEHIAKEKFKKNLKFLKLSCYANNKRAISLYLKSGFKIVGKIPKQYQYKNKLIDELIMLKKINYENK